MAELKERIERVKATVTIYQVLDHYGITYWTDTRPINISCPILLAGHKEFDSRPSCRIYTDTNSIHCFACGAHGDILYVVQQKDGCNLWEALLKLERMGGIEYTEGDALVDGVSKTLGEVRQNMQRPPEQDYRNHVWYQVMGLYDKALGLGGTVKDLKMYIESLYAYMVYSNAGMEEFEKWAVDAWDLLRLCLVSLKLKEGSE